MELILSIPFEALIHTTTPVLRKFGITKKIGYYNKLSIL